MGNSRILQKVSDSNKPAIGFDSLLIKNTGLVRIILSNGKMTLDWFQMVFGAEDITKGKHIIFEKDFTAHKSAMNDGNQAALFFQNNPYGKGRTYFFPRIHSTFWNDFIKKYPLVSFSPKPGNSFLTVAVGDESHRKLWFSS